MPMAYTVNQASPSKIHIIKMNRILSLLDNSSLFITEGSLIATKMIAIIRR